MPLVIIIVILYNTTRLHRNDTLEPSATSVSIFGLSIASDLKPLTKNLPFISITMIAISIWVMARPIWL